MGVIKTPRDHEQSVDEFIVLYRMFFKKKFFFLFFCSTRDGLTIILYRNK